MSRKCYTVYVFVIKKLSSKKSRINTLDFMFILKITVYLVLSTQWLYLQKTFGTYQIPIPVGALIALFLSLRDRFRIDRKIEYVVIILAMFIGFWLPIGFTFNY